MVCLKQNNHYPLTEKPKIMRNVVNIKEAASKRKPVKSNAEFVALWDKARRRGRILGYRDELLPILEAICDEIDEVEAYEAEHAFVKSA